jgi:hypothetical protein
MAQIALDPRGGEAAMVRARVRRDHAAAFTALADRRGLTVSELIRRAIERELELASGRAPPEPGG